LGRDIARFEPPLIPIMADYFNKREPLASLSGLTMDPKHGSKCLPFAFNI
jgi:hypothetical protein